MKFRTKAIFSLFGVLVVLLLVSTIQLVRTKVHDEVRQKESTAIATRTANATASLLESHLVIKGILRAMMAEAQNDDISREVFDTAKEEVGKAEILLQEVETTLGKAEQEMQQKHLPSEDVLNAGFRAGRQATAAHRQEVADLKASVVIAEALIELKLLDNLALEKAKEITKIEEALLALPPGSRVPQGLVDRLEKAVKFGDTWIGLADRAIAKVIANNGILAEEEKAKFRRTEKVLRQAAAELKAKLDRMQKMVADRKGANSA